jgi:transcriptional regulator with XRE-family HTH domain
LNIYRLLGERIRLARQKAGLTQPQLAELLGVSKGIISRWETGLARTSLDRLEPLARNLNLSLETMLGFGGGGTAEGQRLVDLPVWEVGFSEFPDFTSSSTIGRVFVSEAEADEVDGAFYVKDYFFPPYLLQYDLIGVQLKGKPQAGDLVFSRFHGEVRSLYLRRYGGKRPEGALLLPLDVSQKREDVPYQDIIGIYRWLRRPGRFLPRE